MQLVPQHVVAGRPAPGLAALLQRPGSGQGTGLVAQHVELVLEVQHLLAATMATLVAGHPPPIVPKLDLQRIDPRLHPAGRLTVKLV